MAANVVDDVTLFRPSRLDCSGRHFSNFGRSEGYAAFQGAARKSYGYRRRQELDTMPIKVATAKVCRLMCTASVSLFGYDFAILSRPRLLQRTGQGWPELTFTYRCRSRPGTPRLGGEADLQRSPGKARSSAHLRRSRSRAAMSAQRRSETSPLRASTGPSPTARRIRQIGPVADGVDGALNGIKRAKIVVVASAIWKGGRPWASLRSIPRLSRASGFDLAKRIFSIHAVDATGSVVWSADAPSSARSQQAPQIWTGR